jgi:moderate conductance mechanosensitive channel
MVICTIVGAIVLRWLVNRAISRVIRTAGQRAAEHDSGTSRKAVRVIASAAGMARERQRQRMATMAAILRSVSTIVIFTVALLTVMQEVGLPLAPLLTSAGVGGVAIAFGAQSLVKDFLSGIFMIVEDQYGVGDVVDTGEVIGTVEDVTLRITRVRDFNGVVWYVRNGEIIRIGNRSQGWSTALVDIPVPYDEDLDKVMPIIRDVVHALHADPAWAGRLLEEPVVAGVESMAGGVLTMRIVAKCAPNESVPAAREIRERVKLALDRAGMRAPQVLPPYGGGAGTLRT